MNNNNNIDVATVKSAKVVCVRLAENDSVEYLTNLNGWSPNIFLAHWDKKEKVFNTACELPNWNEIGGSVAFLTETEVLEMYPANAHLWLQENLSKKAS